MKTIRRTNPPAPIASETTRELVQHRRHRRLLVIVTLAIFPALGLLTGDAGSNVVPPSATATPPHGSASHLRLDATTGKSGSPSTAAKKRAARLRHEAALRRRERLAREKKHHVTNSPSAALVQNPASTSAPNTNIAPQPDFLSTCRATDEGVGCLGEEIDAINNARTVKGLPLITINVTAFSQLTTAEQMFALTDLERVARNLPPAEALTTQLDNVALAGATGLGDPSLSGWQLTGDKAAIAWNSNWAGGLSPAGADYFWLYSDGEGFNVDCTPTDQSGCWQHLDNILAPITANCGNPKVLPQIVMGAATAPTSEYGLSDAEIIVQECGGLPSDTVFTWRSAEELLGIST